MDQLLYAASFSQQEEQDVVSQLHDGVAIAIGQFFPINDKVKLKNGISFLSKMKARYAPFYDKKLLLTFSFRVKASLSRRA